MIHGLTALYQSDFDSRWLREADRLAGEMLRLFTREGDGLLHLAGSDEQDAMIAPHRETHDGAIPSANAAGAFALIRLGRLLQRDEYVQAAEQILNAMSAEIVAMPAAHAYALLALEWLVWPSREIVIAGDRSDATVAAMVRETRRGLNPRALVVLNDGGVNELIPAVAVQGPVNGKPAAYVCENYSCKAPVTDAHALAAALSG
jgi:hypothetical protein